MQNFELSRFRFPRGYGKEIAVKLNCQPQKVFDVKIGRVNDLKIELALVEMAEETIAQKALLKERVLVIKRPKRRKASGVQLNLFEPLLKGF